MQIDAFTGDQFLSLRRFINRAPYNRYSIDPLVPIKYLLYGVASPCRYLIGLVQDTLQLLFRL